MKPVEEMPREAAPEGVQTCRECGCWHFDACWDERTGPCGWVEKDLCSHCARKVPLVDQMKAIPENMQQIAELIGEPGEEAASTAMAIGFDLSLRTDILFESLADRCEEEASDVEIH